MRTKGKLRVRLNYCPNNLYGITRGFHWIEHGQALFHCGPTKLVEMFDVEQVFTYS